MSGDPVYLDPSALRSLYLHDVRSAAMARWRQRHPQALQVTHHGKLELINSIALAAFRGDVDPAMMAGALADLDDDFAAGRLVQADLVWRRALDRAVGLSAKLTPKLGTRSLDVLHVASAIELSAILFITYDERQAALAKAAGLRTRSPA